MLVKELIEQLNNHKPDAEMRVYQYEPHAQKNYRCLNTEAATLTKTDDCSDEDTVVEAVFIEMGGRYEYGPRA